MDISTIQPLNTSIGMKIKENVCRCQQKLKMYKLLYLMKRPPPVHGHEKWRIIKSDKEAMHLLCSVWSDLTSSSPTLQLTILSIFTVFNSSLGSAPVKNHWKCCKPLNKLYWPLELTGKEFMSCTTYYRQILITPNCDWLPTCLTLYWVTSNVWKKY